MQCARILPSISDFGLAIATSATSCPSALRLARISSTFFGSGVPRIHLGWDGYCASSILTTSRLLLSDMFGLRCDRLHQPLHFDLGIVFKLSKFLGLERA